MNSEQIIPLIISITTLVFVIIQFVINRNDTKKNFILTERHKLYKKFFNEIANYDMEISRFHERAKNMINFQFTDENDVKLCTKEYKDLLLEYYKHSLNFNISPYEFHLIAGNELNNEISKVYYYFDNLKKDILNRIHQAKNVEELVKEHDYISKKYFSTNDSNLILTDSYGKIQNLMRRDLEIDK